MQTIFPEPHIHTRIAIAYPLKDETNPLAGMAIWASVSEEVDAKIREQINWLLNIIASDKK